MPFAALQHQNRVFFSRSQASGPWNSPLLRLIQGIYESWPSEARTLMRRRILTNALLSPLDYCTLKVAAKRATVVNVPDENMLQLFEGDTEAIEVAELAPPPPPEPLHRPEDPWEWLQNRLERDASLSSLPRHQRDRPVGCALLDCEGSILASGFNQGSTNKTLHAEIQLLRQVVHSGMKLPLGRLTLLTTLKPCRMCAAALLEWSRTFPGGNSIEVIYRDFDPGPNGRSTILDPSSPDYRRFAALAAEAPVTQRIRNRQK